MNALRIDLPSRCMANRIFRIVSTVSISWLAPFAGCDQQS